MIIAYFMLVPFWEFCEKNTAIKEWVDVFSTNQVPIIASLPSYHFCYTVSVSMSYIYLEFLGPLLGPLLLLFYWGFLLLSGSIIC